MEKLEKMIDELEFVFELQDEDETGTEEPTEEE